MSARVWKTGPSHDIRRTVATRMADLGILPHVIEQILNHQCGHKGGPAGIYNRSVLRDEVRAALAMWHDHIRTPCRGRRAQGYPLAQVAS